MERQGGSQQRRHGAAGQPYRPAKHGESSPRGKVAAQTANCMAGRAARSRNCRPDPLVSADRVLLVGPALSALPRSWFGRTLPVEKRRKRDTDTLESAQITSCRTLRFLTSVTQLFSSQCTFRRSEPFNKTSQAKNGYGVQPIAVVRAVIAAFTRELMGFFSHGQTQLFALSSITCSLRLSRQAACAVCFSSFFGGILSSTFLCWPT